MKKILLVLTILATCALFVFAACQDQQTPDVEPPADNTEPSLHQYVLARTKEDIPFNTQMTPENIETLLEQYTTTDENEANNAVRWSQISTIVYQWTKYNISAGTILSIPMFSSIVPEGVIPPDPTENLTYDKKYIGVIDKTGLSLNVSADDLMAKLPEGVVGKSMQVQCVDITVLDRDNTNPDAKYTERLNGTYNLKQQSGDIAFTLKSSDVNLGGWEVLLDKVEVLIPAIIYKTYHDEQFKDPIVQISCTITVDNKEHPVMLGGEFAMTINPESGLDHQALLDAAEQLMGGNAGAGGDFAGLLEGLLGMGATELDALNGNA